jgi:uncharacterized SAM-binding protein YcdF (DUF218 family)
MTPPRRKFLGLCARRERWGLTARGWLAVFCAALALGLGLGLRIHSFLAPTQRLTAKYLVVEGWIPEYAHRVAVAEFNAGGYEKVFVTGGPVVGAGGYINDFNTSASVGAELLVKNGLAQERVVMVPSHVSGRDRTYSSAVALRDWLREKAPAVKQFNVLTEDVHARRTQLLFQKAFGRETQIGVIAVADPDYDPAHWWRYSEGVRQILAESIAYLYAKLIFRPD